MSKTGMSECLYTPQITGGSMAHTAPVLSMRQTVVFTYPFISPTQTVTIPAPVFNNRDTIQISRIARESRGKKFVTFRYGIWPIVERLALAFDNIGLDTFGNDNVVLMRTLIRASIGVQLGYLDHESRQWKGFITNPGSALTQEGRGAQYTLSLIFEGVLA